MISVNLEMMTRPQWQAEGGYWLWEGVKLGVWMEMLGPKSCEALASTCRLRRSLAGCLEFWRSGQSRRVRSRAEKKLKKTRAS